VIGCVIRRTARYLGIFSFRDSTATVPSLTTIKSRRRYYKHLYSSAFQDCSSIKPYLVVRTRAYFAALSPIAKCRSIHLHRPRRSCSISCERIVYRVRKSYEPVCTKSHNMMDIYGQSYLRHQQRSKLPGNQTRSGEAEVFEDLFMA